MRASSWLEYSWELDDVVHGAEIRRVGPTGGSPGKRTGIVSRRDKFRLDAGPSREELSRRRVLSVLRKISAPPWLRSPTSASSGATAGDKISGDDGQSGSCSLEPFAAQAAHTSSSRASRACHECPPRGSSESVCGEDKLREPLKLISWPVAAVGDVPGSGSMRMSWDDIPESADPLRGSGYKAAPSPSSRVEEDEDDGSGHGDCAMGRGERKRSQVETIASALNFFRLKPGSRVVDFGCGSGALTLPLAALFPALTFVGVDCKPQSILLLEERARRCNFRNVVGFRGLIETFSESFDACVGLHACGAATDLALLQALRHRAAYVMSPCCVGKLRLPVQNRSLNVAHCKAPVPRLPCSSAQYFCDKNLLGESNSVANGDLICKDLNLETANCSKSRSLECHHSSIEGEQGANLSLGLAYPRSKWLRSSISESDFLVLARAADWSSYDRGNSKSTWHSLCKIVIEIDRNEASRELGYWTSLSSLYSENAGAVGIAHVLVGMSE